jgi:putative DNA primase/helicase
VRRSSLPVDSHNKPRSPLCHRAPNAGKSNPAVGGAGYPLLGRENVRNIPWQSCPTIQDRELFGKLANIFADQPSKSVTIMAFQALTGEDYITARAQKQGPVCLPALCPDGVFLNEMPATTATARTACFRRLVIIRSTARSLRANANPDLREKLAVERDAFPFGRWPGYGGTRRPAISSPRRSAPPTSCSGTGLRATRTVLLEECCLLTRARRYAGGPFPSVPRYSQERIQGECPKQFKRN